MGKIWQMVRFLWNVGDGFRVENNISCGCRQNIALWDQCPFKYGQLYTSLIIPLTIKYVRCKDLLTVSWLILS